MTLLVKIPMILAGVIAGDIAYTRPTPPPKSTEILNFDAKIDTMTKLSRWMPAVDKTTNWVLGLCEIALILAIHYPSEYSTYILSILVNGPPTSASDLRITPTYIAGWLLLMLGGYLRFACYRTMGRQFTFELALREEHKLITSGPYAIVRHPSYTAVIMVSTGLLVCQLCDGSWLFSCGWLSVQWGRALAMLWAANLNYVDVLLLSRIPKEDAVLKREFGEQWSAWEKRTLYKIVPFVY